MARQGVFYESLDGPPRGTINMISCTKMREVFQVQPGDLPRDDRLAAYRHLEACHDCLGWYILTLTVQLKPGEAITFPPDKVAEVRKTYLDDKKAEQAEAN